MGVLAADTITASLINFSLNYLIYSFTMYKVNASTIAAGLSNPSISIEAVVLTSHLPFFCTVHQ